MRGRFQKTHCFNAGIVGKPNFNSRELDSKDSSPDWRDALAKNLKATGLMKNGRSPEMKSKLKPKECKFCGEPLNEEDAKDYGDLCSICYDDMVL